MSQKIIFFGSGNYTIPIIEVLKEHGLTLIVTTEAETDDTRYTNEFYSYLKNQDIPFISTRLQTASDIQKIKAINPTLGVLASYGAILPDKILRLFPLGILNIHPSLLPKYKGPTPIQTSILNNDLATGVTIIRLDSKVDHGPIVEQGIVQLTGNETTENLKKYLFAQGGQLIEKILLDLEIGEPLISREQDHSQEVFTQKITKNDGKIDINKAPDAATLDRMIRAYYPWPGVWMKYPMSNVKAQISNEKSTGGKLVGKIIKLLPNHQIQVEGKKPMSFKDFVNGYAEGKEIMEKIML